MSNQPVDNRRRPLTPVVPPDYVTIEIGALLLPADITFWAAHYGARGAQPLPYLRFPAGKEAEVVQGLKNIIIYVEQVTKMRERRLAEKKKREWEAEASRAKAMGAAAPPIPVGVTVISQEETTAPSAEEAINLEAFADDDG